jgi:hypothetical protein
VACTTFCVFRSNGEVDPAVERVNQAIAESQELLFLSADVALIADIANINPDAAALLYALTRRSETPSLGLPMSGDGGATVLFTASAVVEMMQEGATAERTISKSRPISQKDWSSRTKYEVTKHKDGKGLLLLRHRLVDKADTEMEAPHPDIAVELKWIPTGRAGYWKAVNWSLKE